MMKWNKIEQDLKLGMVEVTKIFQHPGDPDLNYMLIPPVTLSLQNGEGLLIKGPSGSGKTTLLNIIIGHHRPSSGYVEFNSKKLVKLSWRERGRFRRMIGRIDQYPEQNLALSLSADENLRYFLFSRRKKNRERHMELFAELLEQLGISFLRHTSLTSLSGGELQRLTVAIVLAMAPELLICDEPTAHLDQKNRGVVWKLIEEYLDASGAVGVITTHDVEHPTFGQALDLVSRSW